MVNLLNKLGLLNDDNKLSITNVAVYTFLFITAFRSFFSGADVDFKFITWKVQDLDISSTLPLLFSLLNYHGKRMVLTNNSQTNGDSK